MSTAWIDLSGARYGQWTATTAWRSRLCGDRRLVFWFCRCTCDQYGWVRAANLRNGTSRSCGCGKADAISRSRRTHGHAGQARSGAYGSWVAMKQRCRDSHQKAYPNYGGRGITVCPRWAESFEAFLSDMGPRPKGYTLDRINNDGHYEPGNCRWATRSEQMYNRRRGAGRPPFGPLPPNRD